TVPATESNAFAGTAGFPSSMAVCRKAKQAANKNGHSPVAARGHWYRTSTAPMFGIHDFWLFVLSGLLLSVTPGPDTAYVVARSVQMGLRGGAAAVLGISTGCLVHVFGCSIGLSALLMASSAAFTLVKWLGAAYLCYIGATMLLSRKAERAEEIAT